MEIGDIERDHYSTLLYRQDLNSLVESLYYHCKRAHRAVSVCVSQSNAEGELQLMHKTLTSGVAGIILYDVCNLVNVESNECVSE
jgi:hypothetical protein